MHEQRIESALPKDELAEKKLANFILELKMEVQKNFMKNMGFDIIDDKGPVVFEPSDTGEEEIEQEERHAA